MVFPDGGATRIAFVGDSKSDPEDADGHMVYIEKPELVNELVGLDYSKGKSHGDIDAWEIDTEEDFYLVGADGEYSIENGLEWEPFDEESESPGFNASVDSDVAENVLKNLIRKQIENVGTRIDWLESE